MKEINVKRIQYHRYGGPEELRLEDFMLPSLEAGQVKIQIRAAAANPMDWKIRRGEMKMMTGGKFPRGLGHDFSGIVEAVGSSVTRFKVGDEVFGAVGLKESGTFSEVLISGEKTVFHKPQFLSFEEAAALPIVSATAWTALIDKANLQAHQQILITGCLGAVGRMAVQIAHLREAEITGSCNASRFEEALNLGAAKVVDYCDFDSKKFKGRFDVVFDTNGALTIGQCDEMLRRGGVALHIVPTPLKMFWSTFSSGHQVVFGQLTPLSMQSIVEAVEQSKLAPAIGKIVTLSDAIPAIIELEKTSLPGGKLVISPMQ